MSERQAVGRSVGEHCRPEDEAAQRIGRALDGCARELRELLAGDGLGPGLRPLLACLEGALDHHLLPGRPPLLPLVLPLLVRGAIDGTPERAVPISATSGLLFLCFDLLDDLQDGDQRGWWGGLSGAELMLAAAALPSTLPQQLLIRSVPEPAESLTLLQALGEGLLAVAEGQAQDLAALDSEEPDLARVEDSVAGKSGAQMGLYARLSALHAGCSEGEAKLWGSWAHGIGTAGQFGSDLEDLLDPDWSRDLAAGARTLPVAFALARSAGRRRELLSLLRQAKTDRDAQLAVIDVARSSGGIVFTAFRSQIHLARSRQALERLTCAETWRPLLIRLPSARSLNRLLAGGSG